jgi:hypothetical protein
MLDLWSLPLEIYVQWLRAQYTIALDLGPSAFNLLMVTCLGTPLFLALALRRKP